MPHIFDQVFVYMIETASSGNQYYSTRLKFRQIQFLISIYAYLTYLYIDHLDVYRNFGISDEITW